MPIAVTAASALFPNGASGDYRVPVGALAFTDRTPATSAHVVGYYFQGGQRFDRVGVCLTTAQTGAACRIGMYSSSGGRPASLLLDAGELSLASGSGNILATIDFDAPESFWVLVWLKDVATQATLRGPNSMVAVVGQPSDVMTNVRGFLAATAAYPSSMPATAPSLSPPSNNTVACPLMRVA